MGKDVNSAKPRVGIDTSGDASTYGNIFNLEQLNLSFLWYLFPFY